MEKGTALKLESRGWKREPANELGPEREREMHPVSTGHKLIRTVVQITHRLLNTNRTFDWDRGWKAEVEKTRRRKKTSPYKSHGVVATPDRTLTRHRCRKSIIRCCCVFVFCFCFVLSIVYTFEQTFPWWSSSNGPTFRDSSRHRDLNVFCYFVSAHVVCRQKSGIVFAGTVFRMLMTKS